MTEEQYNEMIQTESNIIKFIDNNTDLLLLEQNDWVTTTRLFWSWDYKEYFDEEKVSELLFWHEAWFIKQLLKELEDKELIKRELSSRTHKVFKGRNVYNLDPLIEALETLTPTIQERLGK